jgi:multiple sugar transport system ATP-binding protein
LPVQIQFGNKLRGLGLAQIVLDQVTKQYASGPPAVNELDLAIKDGEFMVFVGPSGCGKSTALRMIAGLEAISDGEIRIGDRVVNDMPPKDRDIAMVFQNYALYPHMTVRDNMAFGLKLAKVDKSEMNKRVEHAARILGLDEFLDRKPRALSGGQRQRVAMGRAIVREPQAFLMDEPLSNLDAKLRVQMRAEIARIQADLEVTTIYVTHDQVEAMTMGDRVAVLRKGHLQQVGSPKELFARPVNLFVAGFIGSPAMNFVASRLERGSEGTASISVGGQTLAVSREALSQRSDLEGFYGKEVIVGLRPQDFEESRFASGESEGRLKATVDLVESLGTQTLIHFGVDAPPVDTEEMKELAEDAGGVDVGYDDGSTAARTRFVAEVDPKAQMSRGDEVDLAVDTTQLHFFDPATGAGIYGGKES